MSCLKDFYDFYDLNDFNGFNDFTSRLVCQLTLCAMRYANRRLTCKSLCLDHWPTIG